MNDIYAEDINYWQTSSSAPDKWMEKTAQLITNLGGVVLQEGFGSEPQTGRAAYMMMFKIGDDTFKIIWPVLNSKTGNAIAAKRQAATMLYHDTKAKCLSTVILGARAAFFSYLVLPDGRTTTQASVSELQNIPDMLATPQLVVGEIVDDD